MSSNNSKWKKALLPTLRNRRRGRNPASRLPASRTGASPMYPYPSRCHVPCQSFSNKPQVSDISVTAMLQNTGGPSPESVDDHVDERIVSVLLESTDEAENENSSAAAGMVGPNTSFPKPGDRRSIANARNCRLQESPIARPWA